MLDAARVSDHLDVVVHALGVVRDTQVFLLDDEPALQPRIVRRDAGGTGVRLAAQRLDASEREHEAASRVYEIRADTERPRSPRRGDELPRGHEADAILQ